MKQLNSLFKITLEVLRMKVGKEQNIEPLINEEAYIFGKFLRKENFEWNPRIFSLNPLL